MNPKLRKIEVDAETADVLEAGNGARADRFPTDRGSDRRGRNSAARFGGNARDEARALGARSPGEDARRIAEFQRTREAVPWEEVKAWMQSWGTANELPAPKPRK